MEEEVNKAGRPVGIYKIRTPEEMQILIDDYFAACDQRTTETLVGRGDNRVLMEVPDPDPYSWTELALSLGLEGGRSSLNNYKDYPGFETVLMKAKFKIDAQWEKRLARLGNNNGVVFALTNNTSGVNQYKNKTDVNLGGQEDNPVKVKSELDLDALSMDQLLQIRDIIGSNADNTAED